MTAIKLETRTHFTDLIQIRICIEEDKIVRKTRVVMNTFFVHFANVNYHDASVGNIEVLTRQCEILENFAKIKEK